MRDKLVRQAFHQSILKKAHVDVNSLVIDELGLINGEIRADIAVLNGSFIGYEIKTMTDNLKRLPAQVEAYEKIFDKSYLVVSENHLLKAIKIVPDSWGIYLITDTKQHELAFQHVRKAKLNGRRDGYSLARLLWKNEAIQIADDLLQHKFTSKISRKEIYTFLSECIECKTLGAQILSALKSRRNWRVNHSPLL